MFALLALSQTKHETWFIDRATGVAVFFTTAMLAHRTLYEARPAPRYLTEFYLWMSFGGALGGMFTALIAPKMFSEIFEYPLLLALSMACRPGALSFLALARQGEAEGRAGRAVPDRSRGHLAITGCPTSADHLRMPAFAHWGTTPVVMIVLAAILIVSVHFPPRQLVGGAADVPSRWLWLPSGGERVATRSGASSASIACSPSSRRRFSAR